MNDEYKSPIIHCDACDYPHSLHNKRGVVHTCDNTGKQVRCVECGEHQFRTRGGAVCMNGHGGAPHMSQDEQMRFEHENGLSPRVMSGIQTGANTVPSQSTHWLIRMMEAHPKCSWTLRPATDSDGSGGTNTIDYVLEMSGVSLYLSHDDLITLATHRAGLSESGN